MTKYIFTSILLMFCSTTAYAIDVNQFCLVPVTLMEDSKNKYRAVSTITIFEDSEHALFFSSSYYGGHRRMRLDGYKLIPMSKEELPHNWLFSKHFFYNQSGNIYAKSPWNRNDLYKRNAQTGRFKKISEEEHKNDAWFLTPIWPTSNIGRTTYDHSKNITYLDNNKVDNIYLTPHKRNATIRYYKEFDEAFTYGYIVHPHWLLSYFDTYELGSFRLEDGQWEHLSYSRTDDNKFSSLKYSSILNRIFFTGTNIEDANYRYNLYTYSSDKKLHLLKENIGTRNASPYNIFTTNSHDLLNFQKVLFTANGNIYEISENNATEIELPKSLEGHYIRRITEMPASNIAVISADNGLYLMDENLRISDEPILKNKGTNKNGLNRKVWLIPVREELFINAGDMGFFMLADKNISGEAVCEK